MFQITEFTEVRVASVTNRVEKHGDDEKAAVSLGLELTGANTILDNIDAKIRHALYKRDDDQPELDGIEPSTPALRCNSFDRHTLTVAYEGWTLAVDDGIDDTKPMLFGGVKADKFSVEAKQGGTAVLRFRVGTADVDAEKLGKLAMHNGQSIWITLTAPKPKDAEPPAPPPSPDDATDLFAGGDGGAPEGGEGGPWPFPKDAPNEAPPQSVTTENAPPETRSPPSSRTARGREKTRKALEEGAGS